MSHPRWRPRMFCSSGHASAVNHGLPALAVALAFMLTQSKPCVEAVFAPQTVAGAAPAKTQMELALIGCIGKCGDGRYNPPWPSMFGCRNGGAWATGSGNPCLNADDPVPNNQGSGKYGSIGSWDVSRLTSMSSLFVNAISFNAPLLNWNTANAVSMKAMFSTAREFNQPISRWDVAKVTNFYWMFRMCVKFNQPLDSWNVARVTDMTDMFFFADSFNQPLNSWDVSSVTTLSSALGSASFNQPLNGWDVSRVHDMGMTFKIAFAFDQPLSNWDTSKVDNMLEMFYQATSFNKPLASWDVSRVSSMNRMFEVAEKFNQPLSVWDVCRVTAMDNFLRVARSFDQDPFCGASWVHKKASQIATDSMFVRTKRGSIAAEVCTSGIGASCGTCGNVSSNANRRCGSVDKGGGSDRTDGDSSDMTDGDSSDGIDPLKPNHTGGVILALFLIFLVVACFACFACRQRGMCVWVALNRGRGCYIPCLLVVVEKFGVQHMHMKSVAVNLPWSGDPAPGISKRPQSSTNGTDTFNPLNESADKEGESEAENGTEAQRSVNIQSHEFSRVRAEKTRKKKKTFGQTAVHEDSADTVSHVEDPPPLHP